MHTSVHTNPNTNGTQYAAIYLDRLRTEDKVEEPNQSQLPASLSEDFTVLHKAHQKGGPEAVATVLSVLRKTSPELAKLTARSHSRLYHVNELDKLPPTEWLLDGIIPARGLTVLFGPSGGGKSFVTLDMAFNIAQEKTVIYVASEGQSGYGVRAKAWKLHHKKEAGQTHFFFDTIQMLDENRTSAFIEEIRDKAPGIVIIDTLARNMLGGDENSAKDMGQFVNSCRLIERELQCAVLVVHHTGKKGSTARGSNALEAAADSMIELKNDDRVITLLSGKSKDSEGFERRYLKLEVVDLGDGLTSCVVVPSERQAKVEEGSLTPNQRAVLETLNLETFVKAGAKTSALKEVVEIAPSTLYKVLSTLMEAGYIRQAKKGDPFFITGAGKKAL